MQWLKYLIIPLNLLILKSEGCKQKAKTLQNTKTTMTESNQKEYENLYGVWVESGIDENGTYFRLPPRRGGISEITFNSDNTITEKGPLNCGFGRQYEGKYTILSEKREIVANYDKTTKYMGPDKAPEPVEVMQAFDLIDVSENTLLLNKHLGMGEEKQIAFIRKKIWDTLENGEQLLK